MTMTPAESKKMVFVFLIGGFILLMGCSRKTLSVFFDGVPEEPHPMIVETADSAGKKDSVKVVAIASTVVKPEFYYHQPFQERLCTNCHTETGSRKLSESLPGLCYECHDVVTKTYKYVHGPVAAGYCNKCHSPHQSSLKKLLLRPGQQLCLACHKEKQIFRAEYHKSIGDTVCTTCHNPHGGNKKFFLK
jgi:predicted CXXCH cytochrome family protein